MTKVQHGTLTFEEPILNDIQYEKDGWYFHGHSPSQFGFFHPWQVGPYKTIKEGLEDFNRNNVRGIGL